VLATRFRAQLLQRTFRDGNHDGDCSERASPLTPKSLRGQDGESLLARSIPQSLIKAHEAKSQRLPVGPNECCAQLQRIGCAKRVDGKNSLGTVAYVVGGRDRVRRVQKLRQ
jgi:hypothetical protein